MNWIYDDGGRAAAGYKGAAGDCVTRAIAIATGKPYQEVYDRLNVLGKNMRQDADIELRQWKKALRIRGSSSRTGVAREVYDQYLSLLGWMWTPTMFIGQGCHVHLRDGELPSGNLIVRVSRHMVAVIDGVIHDTDDPQRYTLITENGVQRIAYRCVYGYWSEAA